MKSASVNITQGFGASCHYNIDDNDIGQTNDTYTFTQQFDSCPNFDFWSPSNLSISVDNSIDTSPFSSDYVVRGATNSKFFVCHK